MIAKYRGEIFQNLRWSYSLLWFVPPFGGSAGPFIKLAYQFLAIPINNNLDKSLLAGIRFTLSGIVVLVLSLLRRRTIQSPPRRLLPQLFMLGLTQTTLQYTFSFIGFSYTTGTKGTCSLPSAVSLLSFSALSYIKCTYRRNKVLGCLFGLVGLLTVTMGPIYRNYSSLPPRGKASCNLILLFCYKFFLLQEYYRRIWPHPDRRLANADRRLPSNGGLFSSGRKIDLQCQRPSGVGYLIVLSCLAVTIWSILLKYNDPSQIAVFHLLTPIFGTLFSSVVLHEKTFNVQNLAHLEWYASVFSLLISVGLK